MRAVSALALALAFPLAACSADIAPGSYLCGPEGLCPEGQACNGPDNVCVSETTVQPFACGMKYEDVAGDDTPATGQPQGELPCVSPVRVTQGCLPGGDAGDFYRFSTPPACTAVELRATLEFPIAFAAVGLQFATNDGPASAVEMPCPASQVPSEGHANRCFEMTLAPGSTYALGVALDGTDDCGGTCAFNRYVLDFALATP